MNWNNTRESIYPKIYNLPDNFNYKKMNWENFRKSVLKKNNFTCRYCGGYYQKYLNCICINPKNITAENYDLCCYPCYIVTHLNYGHSHEIKLYYSKTEQLDIIRKTTEYIIKNGYVPDPIEIDKNICRLQLSMMEFINILKYLNYIKNINIPNEFKNYKIFFSKNLSTIYIDANFNTTKNKFMFIDYPIDQKNIKKNIPGHKFTDYEKKFIDQIFV